ncbi:hypothetical protein ACF07U_17940 [Streptomyces californicus]|uniref:phage tail protein n=1 Tax=Streptomyces californicus TaxID=67351 RepID=UPI0036FC14D4
MKAVPEKPSETSRPGTPRTDASPRPALSPPDRRSLQRLQRMAGNGAVSRLVAQRYTAPVKPAPAQSPRFRGVKADVAAKKTRLAAHAPAAAESKASQDAAVAPPDDKEAQGKAANAEKMNAAKPGEFDKKAFIDAVNKAIDAQAPKNLDEADKFSGSGKADQVKAEVDGKVTDGKESSAKDIDTATKAPPDTSAAQDKDVTPLTPDRAPGNPGAPSAADAVPEKQPAAVTDFSEGPAANDRAMADAEVTEEQLAKGNEPEFDEALSAKKTSEADAAKAPAKGRAAEDQQLSAAKENAAASGAQAMAGLTATRAAAGKQVDGGKNDTKSKDEKKRAEVTAKLQKVYDGTKKDVEDVLSGLDKKVDTAFTSGEKAARDAFTADHKSRMKKYKDKRYSGLMGKGRWLKDKFAGLPKAANDLYQESRKLYVSRMQTVISSVADIIGAELGRAKARIAKGRTELKAEVDRLPADLKQFGQEAAKDFAGKFDDLEATVDEKSEQLVQDLAQKYTAALDKIDEEIKKLQEANKGLIDKAKDAIVGVIKTINELKNLLLGILAKAASAIMKIIKDPIGFLGNLVRAVGAGLNLFITNIADHLKTGVVSWLLGTAVKAGLDLPQRFDLKGIIQLIGSMLGLTWDNIRARVTRKGVPDEAMSAVETSVPVAKNLAAEGPAGAVKEIQAEAGDLKATILGKLTTYLIPTVLIAGITWIISLLNPASAFVRAVKGIIDIVTFIVTQGAQIADFVNAVLDAVIAIANGGQAGVPKLIEAALASSVPLLIGFLAALLGIGGLANKVKSVFQSVSRPVTRAIDKIVDFIAKKGKALWAKLKKDRKGDEKDGRHPRSGGDENNTTGRPRTSEKDKKAVLDAALRKAGNKVRSGVPITSVPDSLKSVMDEFRARGLKKLEVVPAPGPKISYHIAGKVNPADRTTRIHVNQPQSANSSEQELKEIRNKMSLVGEMSENSRPAIHQNQLPVPVEEGGRHWDDTWAFGYILLGAEKNPMQSQDGRFAGPASSGDKRHKQFNSSRAAHAEENVATHFIHLLDQPDFHHRLKAAGDVTIDFRVSRTPCANCADRISQLVLKAREINPATQCVVRASKNYTGRHSIPLSLAQRNEEAFAKTFAPFDTSATGPQSVSLSEALKDIDTISNDIPSVRQMNQWTSSAIPENAGISLAKEFHLTSASVKEARKKKAEARTLEEKENLSLYQKMRYSGATKRETSESLRHDPETWIQVQGEKSLALSMAILAQNDIEVVGIDRSDPHLTYVSQKNADLASQSGTATGVPMDLSEDQIKARTDFTAAEQKDYLALQARIDAMAQDVSSAYSNTKDYLKDITIT